MKKRNGRRIVACALAFVLMIGMLPTQAFAATGSDLKEIPPVETAEQSVDNVEEVSDGNNSLDPIQNDSETDSENKSIGNFEFYIATSSQSVKLTSSKDNGKNTIYIPSFQCFSPVLKNKLSFQLLGVLFKQRIPMVA